MSLYTVISTGRGGAGNMIAGPGSNHIDTGGGGGGVLDNSANEIIMTQEEWDKLNQKKGNKLKNKLTEPPIAEGKSYHHDKDGKIFATSGRGGAGNIAKFDRVPSAKVESETQEIEISPIFSTGRGGAGNIYRTKSKTKTKIPLETELSDQLSPLHSNKSGKSIRSNKSGLNMSSVVENDNNNNNNQNKVERNNGFMKKIRKFFK